MGFKGELAVEASAQEYPTQDMKVMKIIAATSLIKRPL